MKQLASPWLARTAATALAALATLLSAPTTTAADTPALPPLTTIPGSPRLPGKFVWADLVTDDVPKARNFYARLLGWKFLDLGAYSVALNNDTPVAGLFQRPKPQDRAAGPRWFGYISVDNVGRAERAVLKAGGKVLAAPQKMPRRGEQAVFTDPEGALFGVIKSSAGDPEDFLAEPGDWIWVQLLSHDATRAASFYRSVAGYEVVENTSARRSSDLILTSGGYARATVRTMTRPDTRVKPAWLPFVRVRSLADSLRQAGELEGRTLIGPKADILSGRAAVIADPTGAAVGLIEWQDDLMKGER